MTGITAAMVLAAGRGERMRPLSEVVPKPALPLADGPVVGSALRLAVRARADRIVVNTWHLGRRMEAAVAEVAPLEVPVEVSPEESLMGTAGGLAVARDRGLLGSSGSVLVINGDGVYDLDLDPLVARHTTAQDAVTLGLLPHPDPSRWSRVLVDTGGRVCAIRPAGTVESREKPFLYPGVMIVSREALDGLPSTPGSTPDRLWYPALETGTLGGAMISGSWREIGTPADYRSEVTAHTTGKTVIHETAKVAPSAELFSSLIGHAATVGKFSVVRNSVVAEGATIEPRATITDSVLLGPVRISTTEEVDGQVLIA